MKTCYMYWLFEPLPGHLRDDDSAKPVFHVEIQHRERRCQLGVYPAANGVPQFIRLRIPGLEKDEIPEEVLPFIQAVKEHAMTVLELTFSPGLRSSVNLWTFADGDASPQTNVAMQTREGPPQFDATSSRDFFVATLENRELIRPIRYGADDRLPAEYRFLSLYKVLELLFKDEKGRWQKERLEHLLESHRAEFATTGSPLKPVNLVHSLRDKCAHIRVGESFGITHRLRRRSETDPLAAGSEIHPRNIPRPRKAAFT